MIILYIQMTWYTVHSTWQYLNNFWTKVPLIFILDIFHQGDQTVSHSTIAWFFCRRKCQWRYHWCRGHWLGRSPTTHGFPFWWGGARKLAIKTESFHEPWLSLYEVWHIILLIIYRQVHQLILFFFANLGSKVLQICARNFEKAVKSQRFGCQNQRPMTYD